MADYRSTCPQRTIVKIVPTLSTWLPVTLECGHVESINWTAREGDRIGCCECMKTVLKKFKVVDAYTRADLGTYDATDREDAASQACVAYGVHPDDSIVLDASGGTEDGYMVTTWIPS